MSSCQDQGVCIGDALPPVPMVQGVVARPWAEVYTDTAGHVACGAWWGYQWL